MSKVCKNAHVVLLQVFICEPTQKGQTVFKLFGKLDASKHVCLRCEMRDDTRKVVEGETVR